MIESLLIDVNEEIFSLSEELARSFASFEAGGRGSSKEGVLQRAYEFEKRKSALVRKIKEQIDDNHSVRIIRRHAKIAASLDHVSPS